MPAEHMLGMPAKDMLKAVHSHLLDGNRCAVLGEMMLRALGSHMAFDASIFSYAFWTAAQGNG